MSLTCIGGPFVTIWHSSVWPRTLGHSAGSSEMKPFGRDMSTASSSLEVGADGTDDKNITVYLLISYKFLLSTTH